MPRDRNQPVQPPGGTASIGGFSLGCGAEELVASSGEPVRRLGIAGSRDREGQASAVNHGGLFQKAQPCHGLSLEPLEVLALAESSNHASGFLVSRLSIR